MKDTIGAHMDHAVADSIDMSGWQVDSWRAARTPEERERCERQAAASEGAMYGHLFRAAELAYDAASLQFGARYQRIAGLEQANREAHQCIARLKRRINEHY